MKKDTKLKLPTSTEVQIREKEVLFLVPEKPDWEVTDINGAKLLSMCDGSKTVNELISTLPEELRESALELLKKLNERGFFAEPLPREKKDKPLLGSLHLNMTNKCNLKCIYCYAEKRDRDEKQRHLTYGDYIKIIRDAADINKNVLITFTGGEPLLNKDTIKLAEFCKSNSIKTFLLTNGCPITPRNAEKISKLFDTIKTSLDGDCAELHDRQRGIGSFNRVMKAKELLEKYGANLKFACTVTQLNKDHLRGLVDMLGNRLSFQPIYALGDERLKKIGITGEEYLDILFSLGNVDLFNGTKQYMEQLRGKGCVRCAVGEGEISIAPTGEVYPCHMLHFDELVCGNVFETSFKEIYYSSEILNKIRNMSVDTKENCKRCNIRYICGGGCWARAYLESKNLETPDSFCEYNDVCFSEAFFTHPHGE